MAQGLHSAAFTPAQRSGKVQDSFTIGKQMSKPLLPFLFQNVEAHTHSHTHARGCHCLVICNKPSNHSFSLPAQLPAFPVPKEYSKRELLVKITKTHPEIPRAVRKVRWNIQFRSSCSFFRTDIMKLCWETKHILYLEKPKSY